MEEKERYDVKRLSYSLNVKLVDNNEPDWRYIIFDSVNDKELAKLETVCDWLNKQDKLIKKQNEQIKKYDEFCKFVGESLFDEDDELWGYKEFYFRKLKKLGYIEEKGGYYRPTFEFDKLVKSHLKSQSEKPLGQLTRDIDAELYNSMVINNEELKYTDIKLLLDKIAKKYGGKNE